MKKTIQLILLSMTVILVTVASAKDEVKHLCKTHALTQEDNIVHYDNNRQWEKKNSAKTSTLTRQGNIVHYDNSTKLSDKK